MERLNRWINPLLWVIYIALLAVLLPHTAWAFAVFEPDGQRLVAWSAAFAFEASIAALTYKLIQRIEATPRRRSAWVRWRGSYLNVYAGGLLVSVPRTARSGFLPHYFPFSLTNRSLEPDSIGISVYSKLYRHLFVFTCVVIEREIKSRKVLLTR